MPDPRESEDQTMSPTAKERAEGSPDGKDGEKAPPVPGHLGAAGDPAEGKPT